MKTFPVKRYGKNIEDVPLRNTIPTGIEFEHIPGCIPTYLEVEACHAAHYRYFNDWQDLTADQQAFLIGHYIVTHWVGNHRQDAEYRAARK